MPESEPKPRLIELVAPGAGQGWKAVLKNGKPAVVHEIPIPAAEAAAAVPRIQRLAEHRHPALSPILAWGTDPNGIWVAVEPNEGTPLSTILSRGPLTPPAAAALGAAVLSGVAALHEAGVAMGGFGASAIRVTGNGDVRLAGHPAAAVRGAPAQSDLRADVRSCGMAVCAAFGVDPAGAPAPPNIPPGLVVTMRSMASGAMGPAADRAQGALREMASAMLAPDRMVAAQSELALRAGGREMPSVTPFLPKEQAAAQAPAPAPPLAPIPTPFVPPAPRDETPIRAPVSYDAPARAMQTYPAIPPPTFTGAPQPAAPAPAAQQPTPSPVPTWSEAPPRTPPIYETPAPAATTTNPPAPAQQTNPPAPAPWVPLTTSSFETAAPPDASTTTNPPAAASLPSSPPPTAPPPAPPAQEPAQQTWTPVEPPVWKPGGAAAAAEIGTVAAAVAPPPEAPPLRAPISAPARKPTVARRPAGAGISERPSWMIPAIIAVVVVLLLGTVGGIMLARRGGSNNGGPVGQTSPSPGTSPKATPKTSPNPTPSAQGGPRAVPTYAPAAADPVKSVQFCSPTTPCNISGSTPETATSCELNAACHVEVAIAFSSPQKTAVGFALKFFDRCTGVTTDLPGPNPFTPPGYTLVILEKNVTLPTGVKSGALVAVSSTPAVAASPPLLLGSSTSCA